MDISKKTSFIILIIVVIVVLGIIIYQYWGYEKKPEAPEGVGTEEGAEETPPVSEESEKIDDIMSEAIRNQDMSVCDKLTDENLKSVCKTNAIIAKAEVERNTAICDRIEEGEEIKIICKDNVTINKAFDSKDANLCEELIDKTKVDYCKKEVSSQQ